MPQSYLLRVWCVFNLRAGVAWPMLPPADDGGYGDDRDEYRNDHDEYRNDYRDERDDYRDERGEYGDDRGDYPDDRVDDYRGDPADQYYDERSADRPTPKGYSKDSARPRFDSKGRSSSIASIAGQMREGRELGSTLAAISLSGVDFALHVATAIFCQVEYYGEHSLFWAFITLGIFANMIAIVLHLVRSTGRREAGAEDSELERKFKERPEECVLVMMFGMVNTECLCFLTADPDDHATFRKLGLLASVLEGVPTLGLQIAFLYKYGWVSLVAVALVPGRTLQPYAPEAAPLCARGFAPVCPGLDVHHAGAQADARLDHLPLGPLPRRRARRSPEESQAGGPRLAAALPRARRERRPSHLHPTSIAHTPCPCTRHAHAHVMRMHTPCACPRHAHAHAMPMHTPCPCTRPCPCPRYAHAMPTPCPCPRPCPCPCPCP